MANEPAAAKFPEVPEHRGGSGLTPPARQMSAADEPLDGRAGDAGSNPAGASGRSAAPGSRVHTYRWGVALYAFGWTWGVGFDVVADSWWWPLWVADGDVRP